MILQIDDVRLIIGRVKSVKVSGKFKRPWTFNLRLPLPAFTLIESLIVMFILASSMTAALYLLTTVVFSTQKNLARTKAVYLAQECHELARNLRDTAWLNYQAWDCAFGSVNDEFIISHDYSAGNQVSACGNMQANIALEAVSLDNDKLWQDGLITHQSTGVNPQDTHYRRRLKHVDLDANSDTLDLECAVNWQFNGKDQAVITTQTLTNWRRN